MIICNKVILPSGFHVSQSHLSCDKRFTWSHSLFINPLTKVFWIILKTPVKTVAPFNVLLHHVVLSLKSYIDADHMYVILSKMVPNITPVYLWRVSSVESQSIPTETHEIYLLTRT